MNKPLVVIENMTKSYQIGKKILTAVRNLSLEIYPGETLGLVGESGCGKSTVGRVLLGIEPPSSGQVFYQGKEIHGLPRKEAKGLKRKMQMIFQDPYASLNPRMTIQEIIGEAIDIHSLAKGDQRKQRIIELLELVGLNGSHFSRFPHEFSGGQRQRIGIARALAVKPDFLVCDEPISALDVSIQAQIVNLLKRLQERMGLTYLFIAHDLSMVKYISNRVAVMYLGQLMELAPSQDLYEKPLHPYTQALLSAIPIPDPIVERKRQRIVLAGEVPNPLQQPTGCPFQTRCPYATDKCKNEPPTLRTVSSGHSVACHYA